MTERYSLEDQRPPQVPFHDSPIPEKSITRSKTVRNFNSAGNKMKGFFNKKKDEKPKTEDSIAFTRPVFSTSASSGPTFVNSYLQQPSHYSDKDAGVSEQFNDGVSSSLNESEMQVTLQRQLDELNELLNIRQLEVQTEKQNKEKLQHELVRVQQEIEERKVEYSAIERSFFEHTRSIRATDDDLSTIRDSFKLLKYSIARLLMTLNKKADRVKAAEKFCKTWPNLPILNPTTNELEPSFVNLLSEKLVHEHLVRDIFAVPFYPGLKINQAYATLNTWLQQHQSNFSVRLRQQMACVVANSKQDSEIQKAAQKEKQQVAKKIYDDLAEIYCPFLKENDAAVEEEKSYFNKICDIVDKALKLMVAIRGQEVEIKTVPIEEGSKQQFENETMIDAKGRTTGLVRFCICPAFVGGDGEHGFLEKGKVVVST